MPPTASSIGFIEPMHPSPADRPPKGDDWLHEVKYDGYRTHLVIDGKLIRAFTRDGHDWTDRCVPVIAAAREMRCRSAILGGEI